MGEISGDILTELRRSKGLTQRDVAAHFGISQSTYSLYETGTRRMSVAMLDALADLLETSTDYILGRTPVSTPYPKRKKG